MGMEAHLRSSVVAMRSLGDGITVPSGNGRCRLDARDHCAGQRTPRRREKDARKDEAFSLHGQTTYGWQRKPAFPAEYSGAKSLGPEREKGYSWTATLGLGGRLWPGAELHLNPELVQGVAFSGLQGLGGLANAELAKLSGPNPTLYRARAFLRQTIGLGGGEDKIEPAFNKLGMTVDKHRLVVTAGNLSTLDVFNSLEYAHDPRTEFLNTAFASHASFDYPADARGYTWGVAVEYIHDDWAIRAGRFLQPKEPNGLPLDYRLFEHYGDMLELEKGYRFAGQDGKMRLLIWRNKAHMGAFHDALTLRNTSATAPDVANVRREHAKVGVGLSLEQKAGKYLGLFVRVDWSDDKTESYAFTEVGRSASVGGILRGAAWHRPEDALGIGVAFNGLGQGHRAYLAAGGLGGFLGDGALNYGPEQIFEAFYSFQPIARLFVSPDIQYIRHPGYNRDRGPVKVYGVRVHAEF
ncbi:carbohydrate porin [Cupriavidus sp. D39]|uniref:carbohydrate porin n=1 Tax=Cupriavidus sp. D39 TaxID=2997877 RepID=UPI0022718155|nr:carbohydrate porin [Cupriavidus sp. D39]MCY0853290.1 carbohydrate porin [Cupriavidus sp. D39]